MPGNVFGVLILGAALVMIFLGVTGHYRATFQALKTG